MLKIFTCRTVASNIVWPIIKQLLYVIEGIVIVYIFRINLTLVRFRDIILYLIVSWIFHYIIGCGFIVTLLLNGVPFDGAKFVQFSFSWVLGDEAGIMTYTFGVRCNCFSNNFFFQQVYVLLYRFFNVLANLYRRCTSKKSATDGDVELVEKQPLLETNQESAFWKRLQITRTALVTVFWFLFDVALIAIGVVLALFLRKGDQLYFTILPVLIIGMRRGLAGNIIVVPVINFIFMLISTIQQRTFENIIDVQLFMIALILMVPKQIFLIRCFRVLFWVSPLKVVSRTNAGSNNIRQIWKTLSSNVRPSWKKLWASSKQCSAEWQQRNTELV